MMEEREIQFAGEDLLIVLLRNFSCIACEMIVVIASGRQRERNVEETALSASSSVDDRSPR